MLAALLSFVLVVFSLSYDICWFEGPAIPYSTDLPGPRVEWPILIRLARISTNPPMLIPTDPVFLTGT